MTRNDLRLVLKALRGGKGAHGFVRRLVRATLKEDPRQLLRLLDIIGADSVVVPYLGDYRVEIDRRGGAISQAIIETGNFQFDAMTEAFGSAPAGDVLFVNVGANIGTTCLNAHRAGFRRFLAVEPVARNHALLALNIARNGLDAEVIRCAVSDRTGELEINLNPKSSGRHSFHADFGGERERVPTRRLDDFDLEGPLCLWIDTEGHEREVLAGATETLGRTALACIEISPVITGPEPALEVLSTLEAAFDDLRVLRHGPMPADEFRRRIRSGDIPQADIICRRA